MKMTKIALAAALAMGAASANAAGALKDETIFYDLHYYGYEEPGFMTEKSKLPAISIGYRNESAIREAKGMANEVAYNLEGTVGHIEYNGSGIHSHNFYKFLGEMYTPVNGNVYVGLGYRRLFDDFGPGRTTTNAGTYDRLSQYFYLPVGTVFKAADNSHIKLQFNYFISGKQTSYLTQVSSGYYNDLDNTQDSGYGLDFSYTAPKGNWEAYLRYWNIGDSDISAFSTSLGTGYGYEPKNNTVEIGVRATF